MFPSASKKKRRRLEAREKRYLASVENYPVEGQQPDADLPAIHEAAVPEVGSEDDGGEWRGEVEVLASPEPSVVLRQPEPVDTRGDVDGEEVWNERPEETGPEVSFGDFMCSLQAKGSVTKTAMTDMIAYMVRNKDHVISGLTNGDIRTYYKMRQDAEKNLPSVYLDVAVTPANGDEDATWRRLHAYPMKRLTRENVRLNYTMYYMDLHELMAFHRYLHGMKEGSDEIDISVDGLPETKSGGLSIDVLSIRFVDCRTVYSQVILQPARKAMGIPEDIILEPFLRGLTRAGLRVRRVIADAPKRAALQGIKQHSSKFACPYCIAKKDGKVYRSTSMFAAERTDADLRRLGAELEANRHGADTDWDDFVGVKRLSPLAAVEGLDLVQDFPAECMHMVHLGIVRKFINLCYHTPQSRVRDSDVHRVQDGELNAILLRSKGLSLFSRRVRRLDQANFKAEEFRNLILAFWPAVMESLPPEAVRCWMLLVYIVRAVYLPDELLSNGLLEDTYMKAGAWYRSFESTFGPDACSYYIHIFGTHLDKVRVHGPLSETSATIFESHYEKLKRGYKGGTTATGTQALKNLLLSLKSGHVCKRKRKLSLRLTSKTNDKLVYLRGGRIIELTAILPATVEGNVVSVESAFVPFPNLNFSRVLAFKRRSVDDEAAETVVVARNEVLGQVVECDQFLSVLTWNMLDC